MGEGVRYRIRRCSSSRALNYLQSRYTVIHTCVQRIVCVSVCCAFLSFSSLCSFSSYIFHFDPIMLKYNVMNPVRVMDHLSAPRILYVLIFLFLSSFRWKMSSGAKRISTDVPPVFFFSFPKKYIQKETQTKIKKKKEKLFSFSSVQTCCVREIIFASYPCRLGAVLKGKWHSVTKVASSFFSDHPIPISFSVFPAPPQREK